MSILNLFKISYYFDAAVGYYFPGFWVVAIILVIILIAAILGGREIKRRRELGGHLRELWGGWIGLAYTFSLVGLVYLFLRFENIVYANWRLWPALLLLYLFGRGAHLIYVYKKVLPKKLEEKERRKTLGYYFRRRRKK